LTTCITSVDSWHNTTLAWRTTFATTGERFCSKSPETAPTVHDRGLTAREQHLHQWTENELGQTRPLYSGLRTKAHFLVVIGRFLFQDRVKWRHNNLWSRYDLHVVGHDVLLYKASWWRCVTLLLARLLGQYCFAQWRLS